MARRTVLPRRIFLRGMLAGGVSVAVPLPRLFGMLNNNGTAYAAGGALPVRFGTWFFGNGIIPNRWVPSTTGSGSAWKLSEQLSPLEQVKPWLSVLSGFSIKIPNNAPHASMPSAALSGAQVGANSTQLPTIDQVIAKTIGGGTPFPSGLHVGISNVSGATSLGLAFRSLERAHRTHRSTVRPGSSRSCCSLRAPAPRPSRPIPSSRIAVWFSMPSAKTPRRCAFAWAPRTRSDSISTWKDCTSCSSK